MSADLERHEAVHDMERAQYPPPRPPARSAAASLRSWPTSPPARVERTHRSGQPHDPKQIKRVGRGFNFDIYRLRPAAALRRRLATSTHCASQEASTTVGGVERTAQAFLWSDWINIVEEAELTRWRVATAKFDEDRPASSPCDSSLRRACVG